MAQLAISQHWFGQWLGVKCTPINSRQWNTNRNTKIYFKKMHLKSRRVHCPESSQSQAFAIKSRFTYWHMNHCNAAMVGSVIWLRVVVVVGGGLRVKLYRQVKLFLLVTAVCTTTSSIHLPKYYMCMSTTLYLILQNVIVVIRHDKSVRCEPWFYRYSGPVYYHGLTSIIPASIHNCITSPAWDEFSYPWPNIHGCNIDVWEWLSNFTPNIKMGFINHPCKD